MTRRRLAGLTRGAGLRVTCRVAAMLLLLLAYRSTDWMPLRQLVRDVVGAGLTALGAEVQATTLAGSPVLLANDTGQFFEVTANCTYADLALTLSPFVWRSGVSLGHNALRLVLAVVSVFGINIVRLLVVVDQVTDGASWWLAHDLPDLVIHATAIGVTVMLALRADLRSTRRSESS